MNILPDNIKQIEEIIRIVFKKKDLLQQALIHRSFLNEARSKNLASNERLEFLGDAILSFWVSSTVFLKFSDFPEGKLTFVRTFLVKTETLTKLAQDLQLGRFMSMSKGEEASGGRENPALLANCFEALIGAVYLDQGMETTARFLSNHFDPLISKVKDIEAFRDSKSILQEQIQAKGYSSPIYRLMTSSGPDHQRSFTMGVYIEDKLLAEGTSKSKQEAEEMAAQTALAKKTVENLPRIR